MSAYPPIVSVTHFSEVNTANESDIKQRFNGFLRLLHSYLNQMPCLRDVQKTRRRWKKRTAETDAFGNFATDPNHWYTFHHGGRNEAQFNVGLCPSYLRVGLGFEFSLKKGGDITAVQLAYACFTNFINANRDQFVRFVADNQLEVEWTHSNRGVEEIISTTDAVPWLLNPPAEPAWIFVGRLLKREKDAAILENEDELADVMETVMSGFRPIWEKVEVMAHA